MIERTTGQIQLPFNGLTLAPSLTWEQILASPIASDCQELKGNNGEVFGCFMPTVRFAGHDIGSTLCFGNSVLVKVGIWCADAQFAYHWSDWDYSDPQSMERKRLLDMEQKRIHDSLVATGLGPEWRKQRYQWGSVASECFPGRGGTGITVIEVRYHAQ